MSLWKKFLKRKILILCHTIPLEYANPNVLYFVAPRLDPLNNLCHDLCDLIFTDRMSEMGAHGLMEKILGDIKKTLNDSSPASTLSSSLHHNIITMWLPYSGTGKTADFWSNKQREVFLLDKLSHWYVGP